MGVNARNYNLEIIVFSVSGKEVYNDFFLIDWSNFLTFFGGSGFIEIYLYKIYCI